MTTIQWWLDVSLYFSCSLLVIGVALVGFSFTNIPRRTCTSKRVKRLMARSKLHRSKTDRSDIHRSIIYGSNIHRSDMHMSNTFMVADTISIRSSSSSISNPSNKRSKYQNSKRGNSLLVAVSSDTPNNVNETDALSDIERPIHLTNINTSPEKKFMILKSIAKEMGSLSEVIFKYNAIPREHWRNIRLAMIQSLPNIGATDIYSPEILLKARHKLEIINSHLETYNFEKNIQQTSQVIIGELDFRHFQSEFNKSYIDDKFIELLQIQKF